jgi:hypothetical protein
VPNLATEEDSAKRRTTSRHFRKHMDIYDRPVFTGPPENTRDHVLAAAKVGAGSVAVARLGVRWESCFWPFHSMTD